VNTNAPRPRAPSVAGSSIRNSLTLVTGIAPSRTGGWSRPEWERATVSKFQFRVDGNVSGAGPTGNRVHSRRNASIGSTRAAFQAG